MHGQQQRVLGNGAPMSPVMAPNVETTIAESITTLPEQLRKSLTWVKDTEMAPTRSTANRHGNLDIYFCDPQAPMAAWK